MTDDLPPLHFYVQEQLKSPLGYHQHNYDRGLSVYSRNSARIINGTRYMMFDVASVDADIRGTGLFTEYLSFVEQEVMSPRTPHAGVLVECVHNRRLASFLERRGYEPHGPDAESWVRVYCPSHELVLHGGMSCLIL